MSYTVISQRKYKFQGPNPAYIQYLEEQVEPNQLSRYTAISNPDQASLYTTVPSNTKESVAYRIKIIEYTPPSIPTPG